MQKKLLLQTNFGPTLDLNIFQVPFYAMKIMGQPHRKSYKLNFYWKRGPFLHQPPPTSACEWFLIRGGNQVWADPAPTPPPSFDS